MTEDPFNPPIPRSNQAELVISEIAPAGTASPGSSRWRWQTRGLAALLAAVTIALYWPATRFDFLTYDDSFYVTANPQVQAGLTLENVRWAFTTGTAANWHPLTWLSLMLDVNLFGPKPAGFHFTNLLLHALNAVLLCWLLFRLTGARWRSAGVAALFAWHPLRVESVAWVAERKDVLSAGLGFLTLLCYVRYAKGTGVRTTTSDTPPATRHSSLFYGLALLCFALGLMSKPMLVTWPFVLLLLDYWPLERFKTVQVWPLVREKIPFLGLAVAASVVTYLVQRHGGAVVPEEFLPPGERIGNALVAYCRYLGKLFWPADLSILYMHNGYWPTGEVWLAAAFLGGLSGLFWAGRRRYPYLPVGWLWFVGMLVPVIGLVQVGEQAMADRYTYLPSVGVLVLAVWGGQEVTRRWSHQRLAWSVAGPAVLIACLLLTRHQLGYWRNSETLFQRAAAVTANSYTVRNNLGNALLNRGRLEEAIAQFRDAVRLRPAYAPAWYNLGIVLDQAGQGAAAVTVYQEALRLQPDDANIRNNLSSVLAKLGQTNAAIQQLQEALRRKPEFALGHANLARLLAQQGQTDAAALQYQEAIRLQPDNVEAHFNLGGLLLQQGRTDAALHEFQTDLLLKPNDAEAHYQLGNLLASVGRTGEAIREFQQTIQLQPDQVIARNNLGILLTGTGQWAAAITQFRAALRLTPDNARIHYNFGRALAKAGQIDAAINEFQTTLRLQPDYPGAQTNLANARRQKTQSDVQTAGPEKP